MNKLIKGKERILADLINSRTYYNYDNIILTTGTTATLLSIALEAMEEYAKQFQTPIQSGEERLFTKNDMINCFMAGWNYCDPHDDGSLEKLVEKYMKEKFGILLSSEQNAQECDATKADQGTEARTKEDYEKALSESWSNTERIANNQEIEDKAIYTGNSLK